MQKPSRDGVALAYEDVGEGSPMVFVHGWSRDHTFFDAQVEQFSRAGAGTGLVRIPLGARSLLEVRSQKLANRAKPSSVCPLKGGGANWPVSMLRTMELLVGLPPMTQFDAAAMPMFDAFTPHPDTPPYTLQKPSDTVLTAV